MQNLEVSTQNILPNQDEPILPRSAWNSQLNYLKLMFRAKKALDRIEQSSEISISI